MAKVDPDFPHDIFKFIPRHVRDEDRAGTLERTLGGPQHIWENQQANIQNLDSLHNLDTIDDAYLTHLKHHVGWTSELDAITDGLSDDQLRKLIELSVPFWKQKGTDVGIRNALRLLTGRDVVIRSWFFYRWTVGVTRLWRLGDERDPFLTGSSHGSRDQYLSIIYVSTETAVNEQLVRDLVNLHRPLQEAYRVVYCDFVDDFGVGRSKWTTISGTDATYDETAKLLEIPVGTVLQVNVLSAATWDEVVWRHTLAFKGGSGGEFTMEFRVQPLFPNDRYVATFSQTGTVAFSQVIGGVAATIAVGSLSHAIPEDETATYGINVVRNCGSELRIDLWVYGILVVSVTIPEPDLVDPGLWQIENTGAVVVEIDNVIAYQLPVHTDIVTGKGTVSDIPVASPASPCIFLEANDFGAFSLAGQCSLTSFRFITAPIALYFGTGETGYHTWGSAGALGPGIITGSAESSVLDLSPWPLGEYDVFLEFWAYFDIRGAVGDDVFTVVMEVGGAPVSTFVPNASQKTAAAWVKFRLDVTAGVAGQSVVTAVFNMNTVTIPDPTKEGVFIDQVRILVQES